MVLYYFIVFICLALIAVFQFTCSKYRYKVLAELYAKKARAEPWIQERDELFKNAFNYDVYPQKARELVSSAREAVSRGEFTLKDIGLSEGWLWYYLARAEFLERQRTEAKLSYRRQCEIFMIAEQWDAKGAFNPDYPFIYLDFCCFEDDESRLVDEKYIGNLRNTAKEIGVDFDELVECLHQNRRHFLEEEEWEKLLQNDNPFRRAMDEKSRQIMERFEQGRGFFARLLSVLR